MTRPATLFDRMTARLADPTGPFLLGLRAGLGYTAEQWTTYCLDLDMDLDFTAGLYCWGVERAYLSPAQEGQLDTLVNFLSEVDPLACQTAMNFHHAQTFNSQPG